MTNIYNFRWFCQNSFKNQSTQKKLWHENNIKSSIKGILQFFLPKLGPRFWNKPRFWNTIAADQHVFQNRGFTVVKSFLNLRMF